MGCIHIHNMLMHIPFFELQGSRVGILEDKGYNVLCKNCVWDIEFPIHRLCNTIYDLSIYTGERNRVIYFISMFL
jgi:hypothetical protein